MSAVWIDVVQAKRPYSYREAKPPLQGVWPGLCPYASNSGHYGGTTSAHWTTPAGAYLVARDLSRGRGRTPLALTVYRAFSPLHPLLGTDAESQAATHLYQQLRASNFSHEVLTVRSAQLAVIKVDGLLWSDLGEPQRVIAVASLLEQRLSKGGVQTR